MTFIDGHVGIEKESVLSSKIKSEGLVNPCVLNVEVLKYSIVLLNVCKFRTFLTMLQICRRNYDDELIDQLCNWLFHNRPANKIVHY